VPKAAIDKDRDLFPGEDNVWARPSPSDSQAEIDAEAQASLMQERTDR
jgi:hypothetical protein